MADPDMQAIFANLRARGFVIEHVSTLVDRILDLPGTIHPGAPRAISDHTAHAEVNEIAELLADLSINAARRSTSEESTGSDG